MDRRCEPSRGPRSRPTEPQTAAPLPARKSRAWKRRAPRPRRNASSFPQLPLSAVEEPEQRFHDALVRFHRDLVDRQATEKMPPFISFVRDPHVEPLANRRITRIDV